MRAVDRHTRLMVLAPLVLLLTLTALSVLVAVAHNRREADARVERASEAARSAVERRMAVYTNALYGLRGFLLASDRVTPDEFRRYVEAQGLQRRLPGIQALETVRLVERPGGGRVAIVEAVEPRRGNEAAVGLDVLAEPARRDAVLRTLRTGEPEATAPLRLVQETGRQRGFLMMLPAVSGDERQVVAAAFRSGDLLRGVLGDQLDRAHELELYDAGPTGGSPRPLAAATLMYDNDTRSREAGGGDGRRLALDVAGRRWVMYFDPGQALSVGERAVPWIIGVLGLLVSLLVASYVRATHGGRARALAYADRVTADLRSSREDLERSHAELERSNAELERFAAVASHDLQAPLRTVRGFLELLERRHGDELGERARSYVDLAQESTRQMSALVRDLLEFSRAGASPERGPVDLAEAWDEAVQRLEGAIGETSATVTRGPLPTVTADRSGMVQVFANLISNGLKYRSEATPRITATARREDGCWQVEVADNGIGIPEDQHERVFELFARVGGSPVEGTGLGLSIVRKVVEGVGGSIALASRPGDGTRFTITLPAAADGEPVARGLAPGDQPQSTLAT